VNAYQRGNRDGLLSFAAFAKKQADIYGDDIAKRADQQLKTRDERVQRQAAELAKTSMLRMVVWQEAAAEAERMAQALPEDSEEA
jgi:hypothetical protein